MRGESYALVAFCLLTVGLIPFGFSVLIRVAARRDKQINLLTRADWLEVVGLLLLAGGVWIFAFLGMATGQFWMLEVPVRLATGWVAYLDRAERNVAPDLMHVASAVTCLVGTAIVAHLFLRWLAASAGHKWPAKRTFQVLVLVALMFASGLAVVGLVQQTSWLIRTPEPLVHDPRRLW